MYDHILVATDEESMDDVVAHAADIAGRRDATVTVLYVRDDRAFLTLDDSMQAEALEQLRETGETVLASAADRLADAGVTVETEMRTGDPGDEIVDAIGETGADLVVMGTTRDDYAQPMLGSVSQEVIVSSAVPVLTVSVGEK